MPAQHAWWQQGIIYQVYPRSFADANGDGVGDLAGITSRLDYFTWLGVDALWLSPIYPSPMKDFGYDITDYTAVHPLFGTLRDLERLIGEAHARRLKLILDLVPNHTSDEHPWFVQSRSSRENPRRDWYLWRDPAPGGGPPNNWLSVFGGSAWQWDEATGQYYFHAFLKEQPDLNWRNPQVREALYDVMRFWLDKGVDGFRVDVMWHLIKDAQFRNNPANPHYTPNQIPYYQLIAAYSTDQPEVHEIVADMRRLLDRYGERVLIGEIYLPVEALVAYYGENGGGAHLPFNFALVEMPWNAREIDAVVTSYEAALPAGAWPNWVLGNHDRHRIASRVGAAQARVAAMLLLTLRGTPTLYYGDELGMHDVPVAPEAMQDPHGRNHPELGVGRDPMRTPMQWSAAPGAGFTSGTPWLPLARDAARCNVEAEQSDPASMLQLYRRLIELRRAEPALSTGSYAAVPAGGDLLAYLREAGARRFLVALNLGHAEGLLRGDRLEIKGRVAVATNREREGEPVKGQVELGGDEGVVILLER